MKVAFVHCPPWVAFLLYQPLPMLISSTQVSFTVGSIFSLTGICFRMKFQTIFPQNHYLNSWYIQMHIFITTDPANKDEFWSLKSGSDCSQAQFYWNHMGS